MKLASDDQIMAPQTVEHLGRPGWAKNHQTRLFYHQRLIDVHQAGR